MLKRLLLAACFALPLASYAAEEKKPTAPNPQHARMSACNKEAGEKNLKGDERKKFMSECLAAHKKSQQEKMTTCNKSATEKGLKGDERKKHMKECLSAQPAAATPAAPAAPAAPATPAAPAKPATPATPATPAAH